jgi:hypothetical protein
MSLLIRKHTTTYTAWITLSNAQAENSQVVSIRADCRRLVCTIPIKMIETSIQIVEYVMGDGSTLGDSA